MSASDGGERRSQFEATNQRCRALTAGGRLSRDIFIWTGCYQHRPNLSQLHCPRRDVPIELPSESYPTPATCSFTNPALCNSNRCVQPRFRKDPLYIDSQNPAGCLCVQRSYDHLCKAASVRSPLARFLRLLTITLSHHPDLIIQPWRRI